MTGALAFRPIAAGDVPALARLWHEAWHAGHGAIAPPELLPARTPERFAERLEAFVGGGLVAWRDGEAVGFCWWEGAELDQFHVAAKARGTTVATDMMHAAEAAMAAEGQRSIFLHCTVGNARAHAFYSKAGWRDEGVETTIVPLHKDTTFAVRCHRFVREVARHD